MALPRYGQRGGSSSGQASQWGTSTPRSSRPSAGESIATLRYLPNGLFLELTAPYNKDFTETLKRSITHKKRSWDNNDKCWYILRDQFDTLTYILQRYYDDVLLVDFPAAQVADSAYVKLHLQPDAPIQLVQAARRVLANIHHPDKGGDTVRMAEINDAYKEIMGELTNGKETEE